MRNKILLIILTGLLAYPSFSEAQEYIPPFERRHQKWATNLWLGSYNSFRISDKWFWRAEMHYRRYNYDGTPFIGRMSQIYNRHALNYIYSPNFNVSFGGVLRLDFTPQPGNPEFNEVIHEPRFWHEYMFIMPFPRLRVYHRVRIEHRWTKSNRLYDNNWIFRNRWRYKLFAKIPLNKSQLVPGTIYFNPDVEIILQSGRQVIGSFVEDLRVYPSLAYISSPRVTYSAGMMYTTGQSLNDPSMFRQRWVIRINAYVSLDFRKTERKIPAVRLID